MLRNLPGFKFKDSQVNITGLILNSTKTSIKSLGIKRSDCCVFIPNENNICGCGLTRKEHKVQLGNSKKIVEIPSQWDPLTCTTEEIDTDAYGEIQFNNQDTLSKYIRVGQNTDMKKMIQLLFDVWKLDPPKLLISVTGGAQNFNLKSKLKDVFRRGLVKAALSTSAWITSAGNNVGVMKYVGEAISQSSLDPNKKLVVLGITNWCTVTNRELLINFTNQNNPVSYDTTLIQRSLRNKSAFLDPNHTHFILVDNSKLNEFGGEVTFRTKLEKEIAVYHKAPIVVLVLEGGERTILTVLSSVENGSPCVFIEGSGGCADFFAYALSKLNENSQNYVDDDLRNDLIDRSLALWPSKSPTEIIGNLERVLKYPNLLSVFRLDSTKKRNEIDVAILRSLLKAQSDSSKAQLNLALTWNRIDIAKDFIFTDDKDWRDGSLNDLMFMAIVNDKPDFVEIFLENDCDMHDFLTYRRLLKLYNEIPKFCLLYRRLTKIKRVRQKVYDSNNITFKFKEIGAYVEDLVDELYDHSFTKEPLRSIKTQNVKEILSQSDNFGNPLNADEYTVKDPQEFHIDNKVKNPYHELFMYCILTGKSEMAKIFWNYTNEITSALVASKIFRKYDDLVAGDDESYEDLAEEYEKMAVDVLQSCYEENQEDAQLVLLRKVPEYDNSNAFLMASSFENKNFVSTSCFQLILAKFWHGQIFIDAFWINILLSIFLPFFAPLFLNLNNDDYKLNLEKMHAEAVKPDQSDKKNGNGADTTNNQSKLSYWGKIYHFFRSPIIKFYYNQIFYILFLALFSYVILCNFFPIKHINEDGIEIGRNISWPEILLIAWVVAFGLDEIRVFLDIKAYKEITVRKFLTDVWSIVQFVAILLFFIGIALRFIPNMKFYIAARIILSIDSILWFFLSLHGYSVVRSLGPKLVMIRRMMNELAIFILIVIVFIFAYGVSTQALMYHNQELDLSLLKNVFFGAYFVIGGEYFEREKLMEVDECKAEKSQVLITDVYSQDDCPEVYGTNVSLGLLVGYIIVLNILLVNLLIAIFSNAYEDVESDADKIWKFQRYKLVSEYFYRPFVPVPFTVLYYVFEILRLIYRFVFGLCFNLKKREPITFWSTFLGPSETNRLKLWESFITEENLNQNDISKESQENRIQANTEKVDFLNAKMEKLNETQTNLVNKMKNLDQKMGKVLSLLTNRPSASEDEDQIKVSSKPLKHEPSGIKQKPIEYYPNSNEEKIVVTLDKQPWSVNWNYSPKVYTSSDVLYSLNADIDLLSKPEHLRPKIKFNRYDESAGLDRTSCFGDYMIKFGVPLNPNGRQGIAGRGLHSFWGPNILYETIFTRYKKNRRGEYVFDFDGKSVIEFIALETDKLKITFPSKLQEKNTSLEDLISTYIVDEIFDIQKMEYSAITSILKNPIKIARYYKESKYNTDNAWFEFFVFNFHDQGDKIFTKLPLKETCRDKRIVWKEIDDDLLSSVSKQEKYNLNRVLRLHQFTIDEHY